MQTIKERMTVVWNEDGTFKGASLDERFVYEDGATRNAQRPLTEADADALVGAVDAAAIAQLQTVTAERDASLASVAEKDAEIERLTAEVEQLTAALNPPFDPRQISPYAYIQRFTDAERMAIVEVFPNDPNVRMLLTFVQTARSINLDSERTQQGLGYLAQQGLIALERIAEIRADATADEQ